MAEHSDGNADSGARAGARCDRLGALLALLQSADVTSGGGNAGGSMSSTSTQDAARRPDNATRTAAGQGCNPGTVGPGVPLPLAAPVVVLLFAGHDPGVRTQLVEVELGHQPP